MNYDITFCSNKECKQKCHRNQNNVEEKEIVERCGIWIRDFPKCNFFNKDKTIESEDK